MSYLDRARGLHRSIRASDEGAGAALIDFASNDYLGLSADPTVVQAMRSCSTVGSGGSRLLSGARAEHAALEQELAAFVRRERALLFSSGYLAGMGAMHAAALTTE